MSEGNLGIYEHNRKRVLARTNPTSVSLMLDSAVLLSCAVCVVIGLFVALRWKSNTRCYPPGPPGFPIVGNLFNVPSEFSWCTFASWSRQYDSKIVHFEVLGQHVVVLNSHKAAQEIFERRSRNYSDRQRTVMIHELIGWHRNIAITPYGEAWRTRRRLFHQHFRQNAMPNYHAKLVKGGHALLKLLLEAPDDFLKHIRFVSGATVLDIVYAVDVRPAGDERMESVEQALYRFGLLADAGVYLVDIFPALKFLPSWLPGAGFKRDAAAWKVHVDCLFEASYLEVKADHVLGKSKPCLTSDLLEAFMDKSQDSEVEEHIISVTGTSFAGSDTTIFAMTVFFLVMLLYPDAQRKAQEELDRVVGRGRLPEIADQEALPYISAIIKEVLRWQPIAPTAVPHKSVADDWYDGYFIPAGTVVIGNVWAILHDEERYPDPESFKPERFLTSEGALDPTVPDPLEVFGFGRRICPGRHFAQMSLFLYIAQVLAVFTIERPVDERGRAVEPTRECVSGMFWYPKPFKAHIRPRFDGAEELVRATCAATE
ncbi:cytochrome P450 [Phanerochaete sordida]|uniref:Cytochrome P450 n=1 Tax=Phanerochaete sordida TaxID=48140 RepID=A0A9P3GK58_9APHY|nr:cytochrome P450 [Phanerochaete sordida]